MNILERVFSKWRRMTRRGMKNIFSDIYQHNEWNSLESVSGVGSSLEQTEGVRLSLPLVFKEFGIKKLLDAPCGDFHWMKTVDLTGIDYIGGDIVEAIIMENQTHFKSATHDFILLDITSDALPQADMMLCRDCLIHFSNKDVYRFLNNLKKSQITYLLTTTFPQHLNINIKTGNWRPINLEDAPFHFPKPLALINEGCTEKDGTVADKSLGLWRVADIKTTA